MQENVATLKEDLEEQKDVEPLDGKGERQGALQEALALYDLTSHRVLFEPLTDSKALVAWNRDTILVSFRGTASMKAAKLDLKVGIPRTCHEFRS
ncbi:MAG: hypothetical protein EOP49_31855 [Sphingobacteriales bacterium]|nr:MAG: hypothetical protein EOP49_31855 [Sphingobacteriales bacterium]